MFGIAINIPLIQYQSETVCFDAILENIIGKHFK